MNFPLPLSISYFSGRETGSGCGPKSSTSLSSLLGYSRVTSLGGINYIQLAYKMFPSAGLIW